MRLQDQQLLVYAGLPAADQDSISEWLDVGSVTRQGQLTGQLEAEISVPDVEDSLLPDGETFIYVILGSADKVASVPLIPEAIRQTGAAGNGARAQTRRFKLPSDTPRYVALNVVASASTGTPAAERASMRLLV